MICSLVITKKKTSTIVKFTKIHQSNRNTYLTWPRRSRIKEVVLPNLLKQENVCLIPRETEHPSNNDTDLKFGAHKNRPHLKTIFFFRFFEKGVQRALSLKKNWRVMWISEYLLVTGSCCCCCFSSTYIVWKFCKILFLKFHSLFHPTLKYPHLFFIATQCLLKQY